MMGTLATVLAGRKIPTFSDRYRADVEGDIEDVDGVLRITRIRVAYTLSVPPGKADDARDPDPGRVHALSPAGEGRRRARGAQDVHHSMPRRHERERVHRDHRFGTDQIGR